MELRTEWNKRIAIWLDALKDRFYETVGTVSMKGFFTFEHFSFEEAVNGSFLDLPEGTLWGEKWQYGWFFGTLVLTEAQKNKRIVFRPGMGGEQLVSVNGELAGAIDAKHGEITLTRNADGNESYKFLIESYAGHGPRPENAGPCPYEIAVPNIPKYQCKIGKSEYGIWNEEIFQTYMDAFTLERLYSVLEPDSLRATKVCEALEKFTMLINPEDDTEKLTMECKNASRLLQPLLDCRNGSTAPELSIFGQSHLDLAWKWTWSETRRKVARTFSTQLSLMKEYEDYRFLICEPYLLESAKKDYPKLYKRIKEAVKSGAMIPEGGMYVEADTNLSSGESLIRQCLWGRTWFKKELETDTKLLWLPDCFGFSGQLPQIMKGCGLDYFATQKISRALEGCERFPFNIFYWEGIDGTRILTHFYKKNNSQYSPDLLVNRWKQDREQKEHIDRFMFPFGFGDGGGGATREMLEGVRRTKDLEGAPRTVMQSPIRFFETIEKEPVCETYVGEIYLPWHRGTYTSQARIKSLNRKTEEMLHDAEFWYCFSRMNSSDKRENKEDRLLIQKAWKLLLFNQFHDILPGTSITRVNEEAEDQLKESYRLAESIREHAFQELTGKGKKGIFFNSLGWERRELIKLPEQEACDNSKAAEVIGRNIQTQQGYDGTYALLTIPAFGMVGLNDAEKEGKIANTIWEKSFKGVSCKAKKSKQDTIVMENEALCAEFDSLGQLISLLDKQKMIEFVDKTANRFCMYQDINIDYDAWELASFYRELPIDLNENAQFEILENGPLRAVLKVQRMLNKSKLTQWISLNSESRRIEFRTEIDWRETHKLLKVEFPVTIHSNEALEEIQFGYVKRPNHKSRRYEADRFEVCNHRFTALSETGRTAAVLNDSKYGVSTTDNSIELTLLKAPVVPDPLADQGIQNFTYAFYCIGESFEKSEVVRQGYELNYPVGTWMGKILQNSGISLRDTEHNKQESSAVILETMKPAEDGSDDVILRLYESLNSHAKVLLTVPASVEAVYRTDMKEEINTELQKNVSEYTEYTLTFRPFEIITLRCMLKKDKVLRRV